MQTMMCHQHRRFRRRRQGPLVLVVIGIFTLMASSNTSNGIFVDAKCPEYPTFDGDESEEEEGCTSVKSYAEFEAAIKTAQSTLQPNITFCPFTIEKTEDDSPVLLYGEIGLRCRYKNFCYISGGGSHMIFYGARTQVTIQGFVFRYASTSALRIWGNTPLQQNICSCHFTSNENEEGNGGAIRTEITTDICVENSRFMSNQADVVGGAIYNKGKLNVHNSMFEENAATMGGAIASSFDDGAFVSLTNVEFENNIALSKGPAMFVEAENGDKSVKFSAEGDIVAKGNVIKMSIVPILGMGDIVRGKCDGVYDDGLNRCVSFTNAFIASPIDVSSVADVSPTILSPSMMPVLPPSALNVTELPSSPKNESIIPLLPAALDDTEIPPSEVNETVLPTSIDVTTASAAPVSSEPTATDAPTSLPGALDDTEIPPSEVNETVLPTSIDVTTASAAPVSSEPTATDAPTSSPSTKNPSARPTIAVTDAPTSSPSVKPTSSPSASPTVTSSTSPSVTLSGVPSFLPTSVPSAGPSQTPTSIPSSSPTDKPTPRPTHKPVEIIPDSVEPDRPPKGYFNYNPKSPFGPNKWKNINAIQTEEYKYWVEFADKINPPMENNYCNWQKGNNANKQSPLDIVDTGAECLEYHEIRTKKGDFLLTDAEVKLEIQANKMRIIWPRRIENRAEPDTPSADIPKGWGSQIDATHTDLVIPAEHTLNGKRYDGEWRTYHMHPGGKGTAVIATLIDASPENEKNPAFQQALKAWEELFDYHRYQCLFSRRRRAAEEGEEVIDNDLLHDDNIVDAKTTSPLSFDEYRRHRRMQQGDGFEPLFDHGDLTDPLTSKGRFNPYHENLMPSIYFYGYFGSLTEPPCYPIATWRIIDTPMKISEQQHLEMKRLLFEHMDENCVYTSNHFQESVARPIQKNVKRDIHKCTCKNFNSDAHRKATGEYVCDSLPVLPDGQ